MHSIHSTTILLLAILLTLFGPITSAQNSAMSADQLGMLQQMSPQEREVLLNSLVDPYNGIQQRGPAFPQLVTPLGAKSASPEADEGQLFDRFGQPAVDRDGNPVVLTDQLLDSLDKQTPDFWLGQENTVPFFEQEILLKPFGYNLFAGAPTTFAPATDIPVPPDYKLGPGDTVEVQLFGKQNRQYSLVVNRDGTINFPGIGPVNVIGETFQNLKQSILDRVSEQLIGTSAAVSMGALRSIRILILGDARTPGSYTVSGLSTITNALYLSGGISEIGSLRNIQLKRSGKLIAQLDLYDLLLRGDASGDVRLQSGDIIFIPPVGPTIGVGGFVSRPAIYELKGERTAKEVLEIAGGLRPDAYAPAARAQRIEANGKRSVIRIDLTTSAGLNFAFRDGDWILIPPVLPKEVDGVILLGHVLRPGTYEWKPGIRLTDLIPSLDLLKPQADLNYALIRRVSSPDKRVRGLSANLEAAIRQPNSPENLLLQPRDEVSVFSLNNKLIDDAGPIAINANRRKRVDYLLAELERQANADAPFERVKVFGKVGAGGGYPFEPGMRVSDLVRAAGGLGESAYSLQAELTRYETQNGSLRTSEVLNVRLDAALAGSLEDDVLLAPGDFLTVKETPNWGDVGTVSLQGQVTFPGRYTFKSGETLDEVIERAGGVTKDAFLEGSVFTRKELQAREQKQLDVLRERVQGDLALLALQATGSIDKATSAIESQSAGRALLADLRNVDAVGRLVIDLPSILKRPERPGNKILLKDGDVLLVPDFTQSVTVIGEVQFPTSHLLAPGMDRDAYIERSGGIAPTGSRQNIYVVKANGAVTANNSRFFRRNTEIEPGDTIVVPLDTQKGFRLRTWANATSVLYNVAIAVAAINGLSN